MPIIIFSRDRPTVGQRHPCPSTTSLCRSFLRLILVIGGKFVPPTPSGPAGRLLTLNGYHSLSLLTYATTILVHNSIGQSIVTYYLLRRTKSIRTIPTHEANTEPLSTKDKSVVTSRDLIH